MYDFCVQKPSINQKAFYAKGCEIDRTGYKIFFLGKKRCPICPIGPNVFSAYSPPKYDGAFCREDRRHDSGLKYKQIAIRRKGVIFFVCALPVGDKMRSKGFERQKGRLRLLIKDFLYLQALEKIA